MDDISKKEKNFAVGDKVRFKSEYSDGHNEFFEGEIVYVTHVYSNGKTVGVSDMAPNNCSTDSKVPLKTTTVSVEYLEKV